MSRLTTISDSLSGRAAILSGAMMIAGGVSQVLHPLRSSRLVGLTAHLTLSFFVVGCLAMSPMFIALARRAQRGKARDYAAPAAAAGTFALRLLCITSVVHSNDLGVFAFIAAPCNAAWLIGSVAVAVSLKRAGRVSNIVAVGLPLTWLLVIPLSQFGGGVIAGAYLLTVGYLLTNHTIERPLTNQTVTVQA